MKKLFVLTILTMTATSAIAGITHRSDDRQDDRNDRQDSRVEYRVDEGAGKDKRDCK
ncbi:hypothetical protein ACPV5L_02815 [Vibrio astriarenae]